MQKLKIALRPLSVLSAIIAITFYSVTPTLAAERITPLTPTKPRMEMSMRPKDGVRQQLRVVSMKLFSADGKELTTISPEVRKKITEAITRKLNSSECSATLMQDGVGSCMNDCLRSAGVSPIQIIMCGASCAAAGTGVGALICAVCVGLDVTVAAFCGVGCAAYAN
jgi:hypothetical protein